MATRDFVTKKLENMEVGAKQHQQSLSLEDIYSEIDNDLQKQLERIFLATGKGRRPSVPSLSCTNSLLLQLHSMKVKFQMSWTDVICATDGHESRPTKQVIPTL